MIIKSIDNIVNAVPDCSASIARDLLVEPRPDVNSLDRSQPSPDSIIISRFVGYMGGVGVQAAAIGGFTGYQTNSVLLGLAACSASAVIPVGVKATRITMSVLGAYLRGPRGQY